MWFSDTISYNNLSNERLNIEELKSILLNLPASYFETPDNSLILWENSENPSLDNLHLADTLASHSWKKWILKWALFLPFATKAWEKIHYHLNFLDTNSDLNELLQILKLKTAKVAIGNVTILSLDANRESFMYKEIFPILLANPNVTHINKIKKWGLEYMVKWDKAIYSREKEKHIKTLKIPEIWLERKDKNIPPSKEELLEIVKNGNFSPPKWGKSIFYSYESNENLFLSNYNPTEIETHIRYSLDFCGKPQNTDITSYKNILNNRGLAESHLKNNPKDRDLFNTETGNLLVGLDLLFGPLDYEIWEKASIKFSEQASGEAITFIKGTTSKSLWSRIELKELMRNPKVTTINGHEKNFFYEYSIDFSVWGPKINSKLPSLKQRFIKILEELEDISPEDYQKWIKEQNYFSTEDRKMNPELNSIEQIIEMVKNAITNCDDLLKF